MTPTGLVENAATDCSVSDSVIAGDGGEAESEAVCPKTPIGDAKLAAVVSAWPTLGAKAVAAILAIVKEATGNPAAVTRRA